MDIYRAEKIAQDRMLNSVDGEWDRNFIIIGPGGILKCTWLDPYYGFFQADGEDGFITTKAIPASCRVFMAGEDFDAALSHLLVAELAEAGGE